MVHVTGRDGLAPVAPSAIVISYHELTVGALKTSFYSKLVLIESLNRIRLCSEGSHRKGRGQANSDTRMKLTAKPEIDCGVLRPSINWRDYIMRTARLKASQRAHNHNAVNLYKENVKHQPEC